MKAGYTISSVLAVICALLLAFISLSSVYETDAGQLPGLLYMLFDNEKGAVAMYDQYYSSAVTMPLDAGLTVFLAGLVRAINSFICGVIKFLSVTLAPILLIASAVFIIIDGIKRIRQTRHNNICLAAAASLAMLSQNYHIMYRLFEMEHANTSVIRIAALVLFYFLLFTMSRMQKGQKYEKRIAFTNKAMKIVALALMFASFTITYAILPETQMMRILFAFDFTAVISLMFLSVLCPYDRCGIIYGTVMLTVSQAYFVIAAAIHGQFYIMIVVYLALIDIVLLLLSEMFAYYFNTKAAQYSLDYISEIMAGGWKNKAAKPSHDYDTGLPEGALLDIFKRIFCALGGAGIMAAVSLATVFVLSNLFGVKTETANIISNILLIISMAIYVYATHDNIWDSYKYVYRRWESRNSVVCRLVTITLYSIWIVVAVVAMLILKAPWRLSESFSQINYILSLFAVFFVVMIIELCNRTYYAACSDCGFLNTDVAVSSSKSSYLKKHIRHVKGYYTYDTTNSTTKSHTRGNSTSDHYAGGSMIGRSYGSSSYDTTHNTTSTTKRWVSGYDVDEGLHKHTVTTTRYRCSCCGSRSSFRDDVSRLVGD